MDQVVLALETGAGMLWKALWALIFGYLISSAVQVLVTRKQMGQALGERGFRQLGLAAFFGFVSSSCSFAALATSRSVLVKGAHPANALAFLISSTNLVIELGIVLFILMGWEFFVGNLLLGLLMVLYMYAITAVWFPKSLADQARDHAEQAQKQEGMKHDVPEGQSWWKRLTSKAGWHAIARSFVMEWKMVYKEILFGFTVAGFISVFVPTSFWDQLFLESGSEAPSFIAVVENAAIAPVIAFFTFIGSMGNVPLAAMLWSNNNSFGGTMSFLGADLVAATVVYVHVKYYGWRYAAYISGLLYLCMVLAGITIHYMFAFAEALPTERPSLGEMVRFQIDYTFFLNVAFILVGAVLFYLHFAMSSQVEDGHHEGSKDES